MSRTIIIAENGGTHVRVMFKNPNGLERYQEVRLQPVVAGRNMRHNIYGIRPSTLTDQHKFLKLKKLMEEDKYVDYEEILRVFDATWT